MTPTAVSTCRMEHLQPKINMSAYHNFFYSTPQVDLRECKILAGCGIFKNV